MRHIWDAIAICICLLGISYLYDYKQSISYSLEERVLGFEEDISENLVLQEEYGKNQAVLLPTKENRAGELGSSVSHTLESVVDVFVSVVGEGVTMLLK